MKKSKLLILGGIALAFSACSDDAHINAPDGTADDGLKTATITVGQWGQTRATALNTWESTHSCDWETSISFDVPNEAKTIEEDQNANIVLVPSTVDGTYKFPQNVNRRTFYVKGKVTNFDAQNFGDVSIYVCEGGELVWEKTSGNIKIYNAGTVTIKDDANIMAVYNFGELNYTDTDIRDSYCIYSTKKAIVNIAKETNFKCTADIHGTVYCEGNVTFENSKEWYICGLNVDGELRINGNGLVTSYIKASNLKFINGKQIRLLPEAYVNISGMITIPNNGASILGHTDSHALIKTNDFQFSNLHNFGNCFSDNIVFECTGTIEINEIVNRDNGNGGTQQDNVTNKYNSIDEYLASQNGQAFVGRFNTNIAGAPECGEPYGTKEPEPETKLVKVGIIEAPNHNHDSDKSEDKRHLSATCIDFDGTTFYASYHMRGYNWGNDQYDNDETEGCIETWTIKEVETEGVKENKLVLGNYMWTHDFDFNHLILDGGDIITVGHKDGIGTSGENKNLGAIIGRLPKTFTDVKDPEEGANNEYTYGEETKITFSYKYLTTAEGLYKEWKNPKKGTTTEQLVDYKNAGDGNCVIKVGNKYYVTTFAGYGIIDENFNRVKDEAGNILFVKTPYSAKHIIPAGDSYKVLFLNDGPVGKNVAETDKSDVYIATFTDESDILGSADGAVQLDGFVQPIDGKNVLAYDGNKLYACLGKGGLNINNEIISFGENEKEPVNGVALDEKYIYVACGSQLRVLDINTKVEVAKYCIPNKSANYIKLGEINGQKYIAVAFGQEGVQVFRLEEAK